VGRFLGLQIHLRQLIGIVSKPRHILGFFVAAMSNNENKPDMSKLSAPLKALINAPFARPGPRPAPAQVQELFEAIANDAAIRNLGPKSWLTVSV